MVASRSVVELRLTPLPDRPGWAEAAWKRRDGTGGRVYVYLRLQAAERAAIYSIEVPAPTTALLRDIPLAKIEAACNANPAIRRLATATMDAETVRLAEREAGRRVKLRPPKRRRLDDDHFRHVADAYRGAVANGLPPAKTLADESAVPQGTVSRWIAEARRRGYLPAGEPGRVTV